jgi:hypothetical protein
MVLLSGFHKTAVRFDIFCKNEKLKCNPSAQKIIKATQNKL